MLKILAQGAFASGEQRGVRFELGAGVLELTPEFVEFLAGGIEGPLPSGIGFDRFGRRALIRCVQLLIEAGAFLAQRIEFVPGGRLGRGRHDFSRDKARELGPATKRQGVGGTAKTGLNQLNSPGEQPGQIDRRMKEIAHAEADRLHDHVELRLRADQDERSVRLAVPHLFNEAQRLALIPAAVMHDEIKRLRPERALKFLLTGKGAGVESGFRCDEGSGLKGSRACSDQENSC
ncbi:MAG: hypothetical protein JF599_05430 [Verrucomicrobia bacterium]|nr:hypothetical protein [Verrucomicrobiota bacterium]